MNTRRILASCSATALVAAGLVASTATNVHAVSPLKEDMRVLLIGDTSQPVTGAWANRMTSEGVPFTVVPPGDVSALSASALVSATDATHGLYDGVVLGDSSGGYSPTDLAAVYAYESTFGVRQVDGYVFPGSTVGLLFNGTSGPMDGQTATLTATATAGDFSYLKGSIPFQVGSYGYEASVTDVADFTPYVIASDGADLAGVYQHPVSAADPQSGVAELALNFNYNAYQEQWLTLAPGLIDWVTQDTHLGLYRNYLGQDIDDVFIPDNEWSTQYHCVPAATNPPDYTCPAGVANNPADEPADTMMTAADVDYVVAWEKANNFTLNLAYNGVGACTNDGNAADTSKTAVCTGSASGVTLPGSAADDTFPNNGAFVDELLKDKGDFNWITHTWSHQFLGCINWLPMPVNGIAAGTSGTLAAGTYNYIVTAATAYGESEPSAALPVALSANGSATLTWSDAPNGGGPSLAQLQQEFPLPAGAFWGYNVYREAPGGATYGLVGKVAEDPSGTASYSFTDTGFTAGAAPTSGSAFPTATDPGILCADGGWLPATSTTPDASIDDEINLDIAFATLNGLPNDDTHAMVTGEHSGLENPNMPAAIAATGITTFAADGSRQPQSYTIGSAVDSPRYPNNIYYDADNWVDEVDQYNTIYHSTTNTEATILASESGIAMSHLLANDPHVTYAHQSDLIGSTDPSNGYTILTLLSDIFGQYNALYTEPVTQMTDTSAAQVLAETAAWSAAETAGTVSAYTQNGSQFVTNTGTAPIAVPVTAPAAGTVNGTPFGELYGGTRSGWVTLAGGQTTRVDGPGAILPPLAPTAVSAVASDGSATVSWTPGVGGSVPASYIVTPYIGTVAQPTSSTPDASTSLIVSGLTDGTPYTFTVKAVNTTGTSPESAPSTPVTPVAPLLVPTAPTGVSALAGNGTATVNWTPGVGGGAAATYTVTPYVGTVAQPASSTTTAATSLIVSGLTNGTAYTFTVKGVNATGTGPESAPSLAVTPAGLPVITSAATTAFAVGIVGTFTVTTSGLPAAALAETGALPSGVTFVDNHNGTATLAGKPAAGTNGTRVITIKATNAGGSVSQPFTLIVNQGVTFTSAATATFKVGTTSTFRVTTAGTPIPTLSVTGTLPTGVKFVDNRNGTATLSGTPAAGTGKSYALTFNATNSAGTGSQAFTLVVTGPPVITSAANVTFSAGVPGSFTVTTTGSPAASLTETGALPTGMKFVDNKNGTATLSGTPSGGTGGSGAITIKATNSGGSASQTLTILVTKAPAFSSAATVTFKSGSISTFKISTSGYPVPSITETGALPSGIVFLDLRNGTAEFIDLLSRSTGTKTITLKATNSAGSVSQTFTLIIK